MRRRQQDLERGEQERGRGHKQPHQGQQQPQRGERSGRGGQAKDGERVGTVELIPGTVFYLVPYSRTRRLCPTRQTAPGKAQIIRYVFKSARRGIWLLGQRQVYEQLFSFFFVVTGRS